ncbi:zinc ribbon domain-containing protein [Gaopeijia maritima]|uniref:zinc ribbon domain-containing protein n=1 Tax=Gaopeijia maritima TaxID=3119007 RepID=UPI003249D4F7
MSDSTTEAPLRRLHHALVQALRERDPSGLGRPFTVAEIYQDLVPYRSHRDVLGVEMNGDYEHLLLQLLAGAEGLVSLESEHARREMERELTRSNPNTGLFREYAAVDVHLVAEHIPPEADGDVADEPEQAVILPAPEAEPEPPMIFEVVDAPSVDDLAPGAEPEPVSEPVASEGPAPAAASTGASGLPGDDGVCYWCRETLPMRENLNFCPFCGTDMSVEPCRKCGEALEPGWGFCILCGTSRGDG